MIGPIAITRGESAPGIIRGVAPYTLGRGEEAVVFIHGISGSPAHFREMAEAIADAGYTARGVLLPGHGTRAEHLARVTWHDWYDHCAEEIRALQKTHRTVHVVGYSIGSALAMELAAGEGNLGRLVLLSTPLNPRQSVTLMRMGFWLYSRVMPRFHGNPPRFVDDTGEEFYYVYKTSPSSIYRTLLDMVTHTRRTVQRVENPTLIMQSRTDKAVGSASAGWIYRRLPAREKRIVMLPESDHAVMLDSARHEVFAETKRWLAAAGVETQPAADSEYVAA